VLGDVWLCFLRMDIRDRLVSIGEGFIGFDKQIENKKKIENDEIEIKLNELDELIKNEIIQRNEFNKKLKIEIELFCNSILQKLQKRINTKFNNLIEFLETIEVRIVTLERGIQQYKGELPSKLQVDTASLVKEVSDIRQRMENDERVWAARDEAIQKRISDSMNRIFGNIDIIESKEINNSFNEFLISEIAEIRNLISIESEMRTNSDDEIFKALERYTQSLQNGMRNIVNRT
jgi:hypothetical protein